MWDSRRRTNGPTTSPTRVEAAPTSEARCAARPSSDRPRECRSQSTEAPAAAEHNTACSSLPSGCAERNVTLTQRYSVVHCRRVHREFGTTYEQAYSSCACARACVCARTRVCIVRLNCGPTSKSRRTVLILHVGLGYARSTCGWGTHGHVCVGVWGTHGAYVGVGYARSR